MKELDRAPVGADLAELAELIRGRTGNLVPPARHRFLAEVATRRAQSLGLRSAADYTRALGAGALPQEWDSLIPLLTIKESYFFRAPQQFEAFEEQVLPRLLRARGGSRRLRLWSAACARGEEPATLAMLLAERPDLAGWDWSILATDIDGEALAGARRGLYGERAVALVPPRLLDRYLTPRGKLFELAPELRARIDYRWINLAAPALDLPDDEYDLILMRNVLIYFGRELQSEVVARVASRMSRRGTLFLGASETLWQIQDALEAIDLGSCYCYRHRRQPAAPPAAAEPRRPATTVTSAVAPLAPTAPTAPNAPTAAIPTTATTPTTPTTATTGVPRAIDSTGATGATGAILPAAPAASASELLLAAADDLAADRVEAARCGVDAALAVDPSDPAGHLLDGFLHDLAGRAERAAACYRATLYLDPSLFQARVLLADCLLRLGERSRAEHQCREVLAALERGRERALVIYSALPLPDRERALLRCRQVLASA
jgi:chemotaxis protein methyltransferase CheR